MADYKYIDFDVAKNKTKNLKDDTTNKKETLASNNSAQNEYKYIDFNKADKMVDDIRSNTKPEISNQEKLETLFDEKPSSVTNSGENTVKETEKPKTSPSASGVNNRNKGRNQAQTERKSYNDRANISKQNSASFFAKKEEEQKAEKEQKKAEEENEAAKQQEFAKTTLKKYGITEPEKFTWEDFGKLCSENSMQYLQDATGVGNKKEVIELNIQGNSFFGDRTEKEKEFEVLKVLAQNNSRNTVVENAEGVPGAVLNAFINAADAASFGKVKKKSEDNTKKEFENSGLSPELYVSQNEYYNSLDEMHPLSAKVGEVAGDLAITLAGGKIVKSIGLGLKGAKGVTKLLAKAPKYIQKAAPLFTERAIDGAITFGTISGVRTASDGGSAIDVVKQAAISSAAAVVGAAGETAASIGLEKMVNYFGDKRLWNAVSKVFLGENGKKNANGIVEFKELPQDVKQTLVKTLDSLYRNYGLSYYYYPRVFANILSSAVYSVASTSTEIGLTALAYEDYKPTSEEFWQVVGYDILIDFAFSLVSSTINNAKYKGTAAKDTLDPYIKNIETNYKIIADAQAAEMKPDTKYVNAINDDFNTVCAIIKSADFVGTSNADIEQVIGGLSMVKDYANAAYNGDVIPRLGTDMYGSDYGFTVKRNDYSHPSTGNNNVTVRTSENGIISVQGENVDNVYGMDIYSVPAEKAGGKRGDIALVEASSGVVIGEGQTVDAAKNDFESKVAENGIDTINATIDKNKLPNQRNEKVQSNKEYNNELDDISSSAENISAAPKNASDDIKRLDGILIAKGADDVSRQEIISAALEVEKALAGTGKTVRSVFNDVSGITSSVLSEMGKDVGTSGAFWQLFGENFKAIASGSVKENASLVPEYAKAYTTALKNNNAEKYNSVFIGSDGADLSGEFAGSVMTYSVPTKVKNVVEYSQQADNLRRIIKNVSTQLDNKVIEIHGSAQSDVKYTSNKALTNNNENGTIINSEEHKTNDTSKADAESNGDYASPEYETIETRKPIAATDFKADKKRRAEAAEKYGLSNDEVTRLERYVEGLLCYTLNRKMIEGTLTNGELNLANSIHNALLKLPEFSGRTYRNLKFDNEKQYNDFLTEYSEGDMVELKAFTSTSKLPNGYPLFGNGVVHLVIDGVSGRDIADTFGLPRQQEVVYLPGTVLEIKKVMIANDGNPLIFAQEVKRDELIREKTERGTVDNRPKAGGYQSGNEQGTGFGGNRANRSGISGKVRSGVGRDVLLSERRKSAEAGNVLGGYGGIKADSQSENVIENGNGSIINNVNIGDGGESNDRSRKHLENIRRTFEVQTGSKKGNDAERNINYDDRRGTRQRFEQRNIGSVEKRTIEDIIETEKFSKISIFIGNELSRDNILQLALQYKSDSRVTEENFEIIDVIAYDMLSDENNVLRDRFRDEISEYFNTDKSPNKDSTGAELPNTTLEKCKDSVVRNEVGQLIPVYHGTDRYYATLRPSDIGIHLGSYTQALKRVEDKKISNPVFIKGYANIKNPLYLATDIDVGVWNASHALTQIDASLFTEDQITELFKLFNKKDVKLANAKLVAMLQDMGYDGIIYNNEFESSAGRSYIIFDDSQFIRVKDSSFTETQNAENSVQGVRADKESGRIKADSQVKNDTSKLTDNLITAVKGTLKQEIASNTELMNMLQEKFGDDVTAGLATEIMSAFEKNGSLGEFETLFTDGGQAIYNALNNSSQVENVSYSIDESFSGKYDTWVKNGRKNGVRLHIGSTSEALQSIDVKNQEIYWDSSKINNSLSKHSYLTDVILKQVPFILENPVIVMQSKQSPSRLTMFGEVYDNDGLPIMAVIELLPTSLNTGLMLDEIKVVSTHSRKNQKKPADMTQTQNLINNSDILYVDTNKNRTDNWLVANRLQLPLHITNYGPIKSITYPEGNVNTYSMQNEGNYLQEDFVSEQKGSLLSDGSGERSYSTSSRKQTKKVDGRTSRYREGRETANERRKYCQALKASGATEQKIIYGHKCEVIPKEHYTDRMKRLEAKNSKDGIDETIFITGEAELPFVKDKNGNPKTARGIFIKDNGKKISVVQYDNEWYMPEKINDHEIVHYRYRDALTTKVGNIIRNSLTVVEKDRILDRLSKDYDGIIEGNEEKIYEEFIANALSGMNEYTYIFNELVKAYWSGDKVFVDKFEIAMYTESIDAGGINARGLENIGLANEYELNSSNHLYIPADEYAVVSSAVMSKNKGLLDSELKPVDYVCSANKFYIYKNHSLGEFSLISQFDLVTDIARIRNIKERINNGTYSSGKGFNRWAGNIRSRRGSDNRNYVRAENGATAVANDRLSDGERRGIAVGDSFGNGKHSSESTQSIDAGGNAEILDAIGIVDTFLPDAILETLNNRDVKKANMSVFPPYNESFCEANELATRWAHKSEILSGTQKLISYQYKWYIIEKFDSAALKYQIIGEVKSSRVKRLFEEVKNREASGRKQSIQRILNESPYSYENRNKFGAGGYSTNNAAVGFTEKSNTVLSMGEEQDEKRNFADNSGGSTESNSENRQDSANRGAIIYYSADSDFEQLTPERKKETSGQSMAFSPEDNAAFWNEWFDKAREYGVIPKGENPARDIDVPKKTSDKKVVSRFARTMLEAGVTPDDSVSEFEKLILDGTMTHEVITDKKAEKKAIETIKKLGFKEALRDWEGVSRQGRIDKDHFALGLMLYNQCITNKDIHNAMKLAAELVAESTRAGQTLQAARMLKKMTPDGQLYYLEKSIQKMNEEFREKLGDKYKDIELDEELMTEFLSEKDEAKRDAVYDKICQHIADQIPATLLDKWNSWRYLAMLGNPRTHIRNIVGNAVFIPSVRIKNYIGAVIESAAKVDSSDRTKSFFKTKEAVAFAKKDFEVMKKTLQGENAKFAVTSDIEGKRTIFKTKWLEKIRLKNFDFLEKEDIWFLKLHYVDALARLITVRNIDVNSVTPEVLETLRAYAVKEAQAATYRDANALAEGLNKLQRKIEHSDKKWERASSVLVEGVMPFKKTPLNIAKQGINYSPVSILKGVYKSFAKLKNGEATTSEVIDDFAKGLTGTAMILIGLFFAKLGWLVGSEDKEKKEKEFDEMVGEQSYAFKIDDMFTYTIDWMTPSNLSLFIGAKLYELTKDDFSFADVIDALSTISEPLLELSVFSGINDLVESSQYSDSMPVSAITTNIITNYFTQALPTIAGQLSRIIDKNKREYYYVDKTSGIPKGLQNLIGKAASKIPFASFLFEPEIDEWGREETYGNIFERVLENTVSPGYYSPDTYTQVDKELKRLYDKTGERSVLPTVQQKYYKENGVYYYMSAKEYTEVKKIRGQKSFELVKSLIGSSKYRVMSDEEKVKAIAKCYEQAGKEAKDKMLEKVKK